MSIASLNCFVFNVNLVFCTFVYTAISRLLLQISTDFATNEISTTLRVRTEENTSACACVCERERGERERGQSKRERGTTTSLPAFHHRADDGTERVIVIVGTGLCVQPPSGRWWPDVMNERQSNRLRSIGCRNVTNFK